MLRGPLKFSIFLLAMIVFIIHHSMISILLTNRTLRNRYFLKSIALTSKVCLRILNVNASYEGNLENTSAGLNIANHLSYLDVLVLFAKFPSLFITSKEMREVFFLGHITQLAGCFHVERRKKLLSKELAEKELMDMKKKLNEGFSLFLFPEGTSSDGTTVLPFKAHFFQTAIANEVPVRLFSISYDKPLVCWYGDMTFPDHLLKLCRQKVINVKVNLLETLPTHSSMDRFVVANYCHEKIKSAYEQA